MDIPLFLLLSCGWIFVESVPDIVIMSHTPVVRDSEKTTLVCKDLSATLPTVSLSIRREFRWRGSTTTESSSSGPAWNNTAVSESWVGNRTDKAIGGFGCGTGDDAVSVVKMHSNGSLVPEQFSMTSSVGHKVIIKMKSKTDKDLGDVTWYKDGHILSFRGSSGKSWVYENGKSLVITSLSSADAGIYMAHYEGEDKIHAAGTILKVRACPRNTSSSECPRVCPICRNGGICNEISGMCVCLPGFHGENCHSACPPSQFGRRCEFHCGDVGVGGATCKGFQHCSANGCFCFNGWSGPDCNRECPPGFYGAGCKSKCDCLNGGTCDRFSGCICEPEFSGSLCEISKKNGIPIEPTPRATPELSPAVSNKERMPVITNISADPSWMVNENQMVKVSCTVTGNPQPGHGGISLEWHNGQKIKPDRSNMGSEYTTTFFDHKMTSYPGPFWCVAKTSVGQVRKEFNFTIPVRPTPIFPPTLLDEGPKYLKVKLNSEPYKGDGPIVQRSLMLLKKEGTYTTFLGEIVNDTAVLRDLAPYTYYTFRVLLSRPGGLSGSGHPGPKARIRTFCDYPLKAPIIENSYAINDTILHVSWTLPPKEDIRGEVLGYKIRYKLLGGDSKWTWVNLAYNSKLSATLTDMIPLAVYRVRIRLYNCAGDSPDSEEVRVTMGKLETPAGPEVTLINTTSRTANFSWLPPSNAKPYTIISYEAILQEVGAENQSFVEKESKINLSNLSPYTHYNFKVRAYNHEGPGNFSEDVAFQTNEEAPSAPLNLSVTSISLSTVDLSWSLPRHPYGAIRYYQLNYTSQDISWESVNTGKATQYTVKNLEEFTNYEFKLQAVTIEPGNWTASIFQKTMTSSPLDPPSNIQIRTISPTSVSVSWDAPLKSEYVHDIAQYKIHYTDDSRQILRHWNSKLVHGTERTAVVDQLRTDTVYLFAIAAVTMKAGEFSEPRSFRTESLTIPPPPRGVHYSNVTTTSVIITCDVASGYDVDIVRMRWKSSSLNKWKIHPLTRNDYPMEDVYTTFLDSLEPDTYYDIELTAVNTEGRSRPFLDIFQTDKAESKSNKLWELWIPIVGGVVGGILLIVLVIITVRYCKRQNEQRDNFYGQELLERSRVKRQSTTGSSFNAGAITTRSMTLLSSHSVHSVNSKAASNCDGPLVIPEQMIISWESIFFEDITLGEGNFGQVVKAIIQIDENCVEAAVKSLKDGCSVDDRKDFLAEVDMMVRLGKHPNIISLIGACEHGSNLYLCTEFAPNGNLLQFLRKSRKSGGVATYTYLTQGQLLQFALDICQGMAYLSERELIHRDLAARNILLSANLTCKVSDFGLSRGEGVYVKRTVARLPIRWMAIESLNYNVYTTQSDVWGFGVVLWEIVSLGGTPYYGMSCAELYEKLPKGYRMEQPLNCDEEIYKVMWQCWKDRPHERPSFRQLSVALRRMIDARTNINYVNTAMFDNFSFFKIDANEEEQD